MERSYNFTRKTVDGTDRWFVSRGMKIDSEPCPFLTYSAEDLLNDYFFLLWRITINLSPGTVPNSINAVVSTERFFPRPDICLSKFSKNDSEVTYDVLINMNQRMSEYFLYSDCQNPNCPLEYFPRTITLPASIQSVFGEIPDLIFIGRAKLWHIDV